MILNNISDTYISQESPSSNFSGGQTIAMRDGTGTHKYGLVKVAGSMGVPSGAAITGAFLRMYQQDDWAGSVTVTLKRTTESWNVATKSWNTAPSVTATGAVAVTKSDSTRGTEWLFDITSLVSSMLAAGSFYGFRLEVSTTSTTRKFYSSEYTIASLKPTFEITYSVAPQQPSRLNPSNELAVSTTTPTFQFDYTDRSLGAAMAAYQLQLKYGSDDFTTPDVDTGEVAADYPQHTFGSALTGDTPFFWRVRVKNTAGEWSPWSDPAASVVTAKGTLTITIPGDPPDDVVAEYTPPKGWSFSGTQTAFQVLDTDSVRTSVVYADSLRISGTDNSYTSPVPQVFTGGVARTEVRVWDDVPRADTPGDPSYVSAVRTFTLDYDATVDPVTGLTLTIDPLRPQAVLNWSRTTAPDAFQVTRSDGRVFVLEAADVLVSGDDYEWADVTAPPHHELTWTVLAVVNGAGSADAPTVTGTLAPIYGWLLDPLDPDWWLALADQDSGSWGMGETSDVIQVIGADRPVLVSQGLRGYEGSFSGGVYSDLPGVESLTAQQLRDRAWHVKEFPTRVYRLVVSDINIPVVVRNLSVAPTPRQNLDYGCSFDFFQQGELPWVD